MGMEEPQADVASMSNEALQFELQIIKTYIRDLNRDIKRRKRQIHDEIRRRQGLGGHTGRMADNV